MVTGEGIFSLSGSCLGIADEAGVVNSLFRALIRLPFLRPIVRPITRFLVGAVAIPLFRLFLRNVVRLQDLDRELEKDLEQWFRGALLLLVASANMDSYLFGWIPDRFKGSNEWVAIGLRLLLSIGVIEAMPDQELFAIIHPGPPKLDVKNLVRDIRTKWWDCLRGLFSKHLNRTSPVFVIMTAIFEGPVGWVCYGFAITQYLIIGLVTSRDKAMDALSEFDKQVAIRRREIVQEFDINEAAEHRAASDGDAEAPTESASKSEKPEKGSESTMGVAK